MDSGSHYTGGGDPWWSGPGQPQQQQQSGGAAAAAAARLPPLGPTSQPDQPHRPNNKRGAAAASFAEPRDMNGGNGEGDDDDMMEEIESPEVRSFKRLKLEGGGYNNASSDSVASLSRDDALQCRQGQPGHAALGTVAIDNHRPNAYQQQQMSHTDSSLHATSIHRPHPNHPRGQNHIGGRPPAVPHQYPPHGHKYNQAAGQHTADVEENHHTSRNSHEFAPIRANPYQLQHHEPHHRPPHQHHHSLPPPPSLPNAGVGPRCNSVTSNSTDQSAASYSGYPQYNHHATADGSIESADSRSNGASYSGVNHMLGQLHAQRRMRHQQQQQHQVQSQAAQYHPEAPGHHRRNTLSPNWGLSANAVGGDGEGGASAMGAGQHPGPVGDLQHPQHRQGHQQQGQHQNQDSIPSRQRVPSWRRKVQLPSSSNLY